jgi:Holliday junction resolvase
MEFLKLQLSNLSIEEWLIVVLVLIVFFLYWLLGSPKRRLKRNRVKGAKGEKRVEKYLENNGYYDIISQPEVKVNFYINNRKVDFIIRPDFIARKSGQDFLIEVKTGKSADIINNSKTRRQLREYAACFPNHKYILFDADKMEANLVKFPTTKRPINIWMIVISFCLGAACVLYLKS